MILKKRAPTHEPFKVRSLAEADPAYAGLLEKRAELRAARSRLDSEESDILFRLANDKPADAPLNRRVAALLGDEVDDANPATDGLRARFSVCQAERRDVDAALRIVEERLHAARGAASTAILSDVEPEYRKRVAELAAALAQAYAAHLAVEEIVGSLQRADVAWVRPVFTEGRATQIFETRVGAWFRGAAVAGLIEKSAIPEGLK